MMLGISYIRLDYAAQLTSKDCVHVYSMSKYHACVLGCIGLCICV